MRSHLTSIIFILLSAAVLVGCNDLMDQHDNHTDNLSEQRHPDEAMNTEHEQHAPSMFQQNTNLETHLCPMHPHITGQEGDNCPICGMDLVPRENQSSNAQAEDHIFSVDPAYVQSLGVKTTTVNTQTFGRNLRAFGQVTENTRLQKTINVRTKGWIVNLYKDAVGDAVKKGDLLFTYYSPELMKAQSDYLVGSHRENAAERLKLLGMSNRAIKKVEKNGKFLDETPFYATASGIISELNTQNGDFLPEGAQVFMLQDYSTVWVMVDVPLQHLEFLAVGTPTRVKQPETGKQRATEIDFIYPTNNVQTRTAKVRLKLNNTQNEFKPNTLLDVTFDAQSQERLAVPKQAILFSQSGAFVIESLGEGSFKPLRIQTGISNQEWTEVTAGLKEGQTIVTSGQFMLDAESNLRGGFSSMTANDSDQTEVTNMGGNAHAH